jgi:hypothetical protein
MTKILHCMRRSAAMPKLFAHQSILKSHTPQGWNSSLDNMKSVESEEVLVNLAHIRRQFVQT